MPLSLDTEIQYLKGVGPRRAAAFARLGVQTVRDLLHHFPFRHELDLQSVDIADLRDGALATVRGEVLSVRIRWPRCAARLVDGTGECTLQWFNMPASGLRIERGATVVAHGPVRAGKDGMIFVQPTVRSFHRDASIELSRGGERRVGVYSAAPPLTSAMIREAVRVALRDRTLKIPEFLPAWLLERRQLPAEDWSVRQMHSPNSDADLARARDRLAYGELLLMELAVCFRRAQASTEQATPLRITNDIDERIRARFPFALTAGQNAVIAEIRDDLQRDRPMRRLLQGDVGCGKTVVALYACLAAVANGAQAVLMAPTEILAQQHLRRIAEFLRESRVRIALLTGSTARNRRSSLRQQIQSGEVDLVIGTHALGSEGLSFRNLAVVVVDEQHKFGVLQRAALRTKGLSPHYLVMTATPIPRTLALTVFGDLDVSVIRDLPAGRPRVLTRVVHAGQWDTVMHYVRRRLERGEQAYVICPRIGETSDVQEAAQSPEADARTAAAASSVRVAPPATARTGRALRERPSATPMARRLMADAGPSVLKTYERLIKGPWAGMRVELLHGGQSPAEIAAVMDRFIRGETQALVATTIVEVGLDVPNATIMVIEHADRFGLSQLHQLRGRIGRGRAESLCVLIAGSAHRVAQAVAGPARPGAEPPSPAMQRLAIMARSHDGFRIAEEDLRIRGPGEFLGTRQHGLPELRVADLVADWKLVEKAREDAAELVRTDPRLRKPEHRGLIRKLLAIYPDARLKLLEIA